MSSPFVNRFPVALKVVEKTLCFLSFKIFKKPVDIKL